MPYISKEEVNVKRNALKVLNKKYNVKATFSGGNSSKLTLTVVSGAIDFISNYNEVAGTRHSAAGFNPFAKGYIQVNHYYLDRAFSGVALEYLQKAYAIMLDGHWDESDSMTDYFSCAYYNSIQIGKWDKPYVLTN